MRWTGHCSIPNTNFAHPLVRTRGADGNSTGANTFGVKLKLADATHTKHVEFLEGWIVHLTVPRIASVA